ncbi:MAG: DNA translocase FtsK [Gemmatimonadota bacterium]|nr:DNA translocase FtsK [Gemmatimonadota bacterium]MDE3006794.1 DNA translocase FtsK [Gemmatimonadota bacterium]MDE3014321.1 DNA translocase FtsK [Gemmatimonadota bacterium]
MTSKKSKGKKTAPKKKASKSGRSRKRSGGDGLLSREQQREILAVALFGVSLLFLLSLFPVGVFGARSLEWFPSGNMIGVVGGTIRGLLVAFVGGSAVVVPVVIACLGLWSGEWMPSWRALRFGLLSLGLLFLLPIATWIGTQSEVAAGWLGTALGDPLVGLLGTVGATVVTATIFVALSVTTLGWNPLRSVGRGVLVGGDAAGRTMKAVADRSREAAAAALAEQRESQVIEEVAPIEGMEPEWAAEDRDIAAAVVSAVEDAADGSDDDDLPWSDALDDEGAVQHAGEASREEEADAVGVSEDADDANEFEDDDGLADPNADVLMEHEVPPVGLLSAPEFKDRASMERQLDALGHVLVEKLGTFNIKSSLGGRTTGPVVTQFEVVPAPGVKVNRIANLDADLALAMKARTIRIVAPIPGKGAVGVEIPNPAPEIVNLREILESREFTKAKGVLPLALGKDLNGTPYVSQLEKMPHVLIAGATGAGKSVCLNTIVTSLVYRHTPETLRLLMIDPKMVELSVYSRLPHLRHNVVTDPRDAAGVLKWAVIEMERRYALLKANHVRSIGEFNKKVRGGQVLRRSEPKGPEGDENRWIYAEGIMPYIVVVVDELADLMMTVQSEVEKPLTQLAQKARAIGIHLIVATQRPSVNVITGLIKANFPTRIAFRVASKTDSRTILDQNGADALLGNGDMLFLPPGGSIPVRIQGAFLPTEDTERLMAWYVELLERHAEETGQSIEAPDEPDILEEVRGAELEEDGSGPEEIRGDWDGLFQKAAEVCIQNGTGSTSLLQRKLGIGYGRAARIVDQLHDAGVLGPSEGSKGREVLMMHDELERFMSGE